MKNKLIAALLTISSLVFSGTVNIHPANSLSNIAFSNTDINYEQLKDYIGPELVNVELLIPPRIQQTSDEVPLYYTVHEAKSNEYLIGLEFTPDCNFAGACSLGSWSGKEGNHLPKASDYSYKTPMYPLVKGYQYVELDNGYQAVVVHGCGAYCTGGISWMINGATYSLYGKTTPDSKEHTKHFIDLANSIYSK